MNDEIRNLGQDETVPLHLGAKVARQVSHALQSDQEIAGNGVEIGLGGADGRVRAGQGVQAGRLARRIAGNLSRRA